MVGLDENRPVTRIYKMKDHTASTIFSGIYIVRRGTSFGPCSNARPIGCTLFNRAKSIAALTRKWAGIVFPGKAIFAHNHIGRALAENPIGDQADI